MAKEVKKEINISEITEIDTNSLLKKSKELYSEKYAKKFSQLLEDNMRLEKALKFVREHIRKVSEGDILSIESYLESRKKLEEEE